MELLHTFSDNNKMAKIYRLDVGAYFIRFHENDVIGEYTVVKSEEEAEILAEDFVMDLGYTK